MKEKIADNMILRSVYLPPDIDQRLRALAFTESVSKGDVIREMLERGLAASGKKTLAEQLVIGATARKHAAKKKASATRSTGGRALVSLVRKSAAKKSVAKKSGIKKAAAKKAK